MFSFTFSLSLRWRRSLRVKGNNFTTSSPVAISFKNSFKAWNYRLQGRSRPVSTGVINKIAYLPVVNTIQAMKLHLWFLLDLGMHLYHTVFAVRLSLLSFAVTALLPSQCYHHAAVTPLTFHNQTVKLQSVTDDSKFIFFIYWREYKFNL